MTTRRPLLWVLFGSLMMLLAAPMPDAEGRSRRRSRKARRVSPEEAAKALQKKYFMEAQGHYQAGRYAEAAEAFKKAFEARPHRSLQVNIAMAFASMGDNVQAYHHLQTYMKMREPADPPLPDVLQKLPLKIGSIVIRCPDPNAGIFVDGQLKGNTEVTLFFEPSKRVVDVRQEDRIVATRIIEVKGGQEHIWEVTKQMLEAAKPRPIVIVQPPPPRREVVLPPPVPVQTDAEKRARLHWAYFTAVAALAAAAAGAAAYTSFKNQQVHNDFVKDPWNKDLQQEGILYQNTTNGLWGAAAAAAVTAGILAVFTRWKAKKPKESAAASVSVTPWAGPGNLGVSLSLSGQ